MLNRTKNILIRAALLAALTGSFAAAPVAGNDGVAEAQRRARTSMVTRPPASTSEAGVVNINTAGQSELSRLPGIGPSKAAAIIAYRERGRRFRRIEDLLRVRGIGRATFRRLRPMLTVQGPTTLGGSSGAQTMR
jgi:competence protein ComEA